MYAHLNICERKCGISTLSVTLGSSRLGYRKNASYHPPHSTGTWLTHSKMIRKSCHRELVPGILSLHESSPYIVRAHPLSGRPNMIDMNPPALGTTDSDTYNESALEEPCRTRCKGLPLPSARNQLGRQHWRQCGLERKTHVERMNRTQPTQAGRECCSSVELHVSDYRFP